MSDTPPEDFVVWPEDAGPIPDPPTIVANFRKGEYMPFFGNRCFASAAWVKAASDDIRVAMLKLWWHAWANETPAGSLPNDCVMLSRVVGFSYLEFSTRASELIRGFYLASDGRLYHRYLVEIITELQTKRDKKSADMRQFRAGGDVANLQSRKQGDVGDKRKEIKEKEDKKNNHSLRNGPQPEPSQEILLKPRPVEELQPAVEAYNSAAVRVGWPQVQRLSEPRRAALRQRLAECGGLQGWMAALEKAEASSFLTGKTGRNGSHPNWVMGFDFITKQTNFTKLMEGNYDDRQGPQPASGAGPNGDSATQRALRGILAADLRPGGSGRDGAD